MERVLIGKGLSASGPPPQVVSLPDPRSGALASYLVFDRSASSPGAEGPLTSGAPADETPPSPSSCDAVSPKPPPAPRATCVYELRHASCRFGSWFVGDRVSSERGATLASAIDPVFLALSALVRAEGAGMLSVEDLFERFLFEPEHEENNTTDRETSGLHGNGDDGGIDGDDLGDDAAIVAAAAAISAAAAVSPTALARSRARRALAQALSRGAALACVCETRTVEADSYVRLSRRKLSGWLAAKARQAAVAMRLADPAGWEGLGPSASLEAGIALIDEWLPDANEWGGEGGKGAANARGLLEAIEEARRAARTLLGLSPVSAAVEAVSDVASAPDAMQATPGGIKRPRDPAQAAREKAAASRLATKEAKRKKDAQGTRKLSGFFVPVRKT